MQTRHCIRLICAVAIAIPVLGVREFGACASADVNGDHRVDVLDLQVIIARALHAGHTNVLDFQRVLHQMQLGKHDRQIPPARPGGPDNCIFSYQTGRMADLVDRPVESESTVVFPPVLTEPGEHPERCIVPTTTERYLFILTPNAPPFSA